MLLPALRRTGTALCALTLAIAPRLMLADETARGVAPPAGQPESAVVGTTQAPPGRSRKPAAPRARGGTEEVIVTARRRSEVLSKVPVSVTVFDTHALEQRKVTSEADLTSLVPGLNVTVGENSTEFDFTIRGQTTDAFSGSPPGVLAYLNEVALAPHSETGTSFFDLGSIQVLKGPQGTLFGRNDTGGAVLYTTQQPNTSATDGYITASAGNYAYGELQGAVNLPLIDNVLAVRIAADVTHRDGYVKNISDGERLGDTSHQAVRATILYTPNDQLKNTLFMEYRRTDDTAGNGEIYSVYGAGETNNGYPLTALAADIYGPAVEQALIAQERRGYYDADIWLTPRLAGNSTFLINTTSYAIDADTTLKNIVGYSRAFTNEQADLGGSPYGVISLIDLNNPTQGNHYYQDTISEEFQVQGKALNSHLQYIVGAYFYRNSEETKSPVVVGATLPTPIEAFGYNNVYTDFSGAVFAQGTYDLADLTGVHGLGFTAGIRNTWEGISLDQIPGSLFFHEPAESTRESKPSWQVGLQEQLTPQLLLYFVTRGSWRAGGFSGTATPGPTTNTFGPETTYDFEVGGKYSGKLYDIPTQLNVALYDQVVDNAERDIYYIVDGTVGSLTTNIPEATIKGVEADGRIRPLPWFSTGFQVAYTDAQWTKPTITLPGGESTAASTYSNAPSLSGSVYGQIDLPTPERIGAMMVRADLYGQDHYYFSNFSETLSPRTRLPGYDVLNLRYEWNFFNRNIVLALWGKNVLDRKYLTGGTAFGPSSGINVAFPGAPQTFGFDATYRF
jgi:iron complex outermembrane receptor protein